jgi:hypothetical protein
MVEIVELLGLRLSMVTEPVEVSLEWLMFWVAEPVEAKLFNNV